MKNEKNSPITVEVTPKLYLNNEGSKTGEGYELKKHLDLTKFQIKK